MGSLRFVGALSLGFALACLSLGSFKVVGSSADSSCSGVLDFCIKATCRVKNTGSRAAPATVTFTLKKPDGSTVTASEYAMINPKEVKTVSHNFDEAKLVQADRTKVSCKVKPAS